MRRYPFPAMTAGVVSAALCSVTAAGGATNAVTDVTTNAPIVVTASRAGRTAQEMPANVTVITAQAIHDSGAQNVVDALEKIGGLYFRHSSDNPGQADVSMHGFGDNSHGRVLVLIDGQRLNTADMAALDWLRLPVGSVDRIEVLRGGQTALYGDYAVAGVINIITHQPSDQPVTTLGVTAGSDRTLGGHIGHSGTLGDTRYTADADWLASDGWRNNSDYENTDVRATLAHDWTEHFSTDLSGFFSDNTYGMPGTLTKAQMDQDPRQTTTPFNEARTVTLGGNLSADGQIDPDNHLAGTLSASRRTITSDMVSYLGYGSPFTDTTLDSVAFTPHDTLETDLAGHRDRLLTGVDLGLEQYDLQGYADPTRTNRNESSTLERAHAGLYAQNEFWLTRQLSLTLGARGELCRYASDVTTNVGAGAVTSSTRIDRQSALDAALLYRPTDRVKLYARAATLYRDPFVDEMTTVNQGFVPPNALPENNLKPEVGEQLELGASATVAKEWTADLSVYRLDMKDEIAWVPVGPFGQYGYNGNLDQTRRYGADTSLTWQRRDVGLASLAYNYVDAAFSAGPNRDDTIPLVPTQVLTLRGELELPFDLTALATGRAVSGQYLSGDDANQGARLPGYGTLDLGLRYHPHQLAGFEILFGVDNVFDRTYANSGYYSEFFGTQYYSYYPAAGRTWRLGANYRF